MDDLAASDKGCSSQSFASSCTSSSPSLSLQRPQQPRQDSSTHVFPARPSGSSSGLSTRGPNNHNSRAALRELLNPDPSTLGSTDRTRLLNNGLQWLLEASLTQRASVQPSAPLSHEAVGTLNFKSGRCSTVHGDTRNDVSLGSRSTKTWLDDQVKVKALPPW